MLPLILFFPLLILSGFSVSLSLSLCMCICLPLDNYQECPQSSFASDKEAPPTKAASHKRKRWQCSSSPPSSSHIPSGEEASKKPRLGDVMATPFSMDFSQDTDKIREERDETMESKQNMEVILTSVESTKVSCSENMKEVETPERSVEEMGEKRPFTPPSGEGGLRWRKRNNTYTKSAEEEGTCHANKRRRSTYSVSPMVGAGHVTGVVSPAPVEVAAQDDEKSKKDVMSLLEERLRERRETNVLIWFLCA